MVATRGVGAIGVGETGIVGAAANFWDEGCGELLRRGVFVGRHMREVDGVAEGVRFGFGGKFPERGDVRIGQAEGMEVESVGIGKFEEFLFAAAEGDDGLVGEVVAMGSLDFVAQGGVDYAAHVGFIERANVLASGDGLDGCGCGGAFGGAGGGAMDWVTM